MLGHVNIVGHDGMKLIINGQCMLVEKNLWGITK